ncbi:MAG TPA: hypothetical protein PKD61_13005, partial [Polyangiaceae bacterium]|nr:hypothetical protein [Polyangiaceae bacterium]
MNRIERCSSGLVGQRKREEQDHYGRWDCRGPAAAAARGPTLGERDQHPDSKPDHCYVSGANRDDFTNA